MTNGKDEGTLPTHGAKTLPSVEVDDYNLEIEDEEGFIGDKASKGAFRRMLDEVKEVLRKDDEDPFGDKDSEDIRKKKLDAVLAKGDAEAAAVVQSAIEKYSSHRSYGGSCATNPGRIPSALCLVVGFAPAGGRARHCKDRDSGKGPLESLRPRDEAVAPSRGRRTGS
jgi:hypothetical protein